MAARHRQQRPLAPTSAASVTSTSKHSQQPVSLSKRLLFPHLPPTADLPPLLASPSIPPELTYELYDLIALSLRAFVGSWWSKITRYDKEFLPEVTRILTVVVRALEARVLAADLAPLVLQDVPILITQHYRDYRNAEAKLSTSYASGGAASLPQLFHQLQPHMAIGPDGKIDEEYFRQIVDHILKSCLPPEDYDPEPERYIIREIVLKVFLRDVIPKVTQPWFVHKTILDSFGPKEDTSSRKPLDSKSLHATSRSSSPSSTSFSFHTLLVVLLSTLQAFSGACLALIHAYKQARNTIKHVNQTPSVTFIASSRTPPSQPSVSSPPRTLTPPSPVQQISPSTSTSSLSTSSFRPPPQNTLNGHDSATTARNDFAQPVLMMVAEIFVMRERFASSNIISSLSMLSSLMTPFLNRLLPYLFTSSFSPSNTTQMVHIIKRTLFPNGYPAPPASDPTQEEQAAMRERLVGWRASGALAHLTPFILGQKPKDTLGAALDPLSSAPCNVHLLLLILDRVLVGLFPELGADVTMG